MPGIKPLGTRIIIALAVLCGAVLPVRELARWHSDLPMRYGCCLAVAVVTAGSRVLAPAMRGSLPVSFPFVLYGILEFTLPETLLLAWVTAGVQTAFERSRRFGFVRTLFSASVAAIATSAAAAAYARAGPAARFPAAAIVFFASNATLHAIVDPASKTTLWAFVYYLGGVAVTGLMILANRYVGWQTALLVIPVVYLVYRSYSLYVGRLEDEKLHAEEMAALHLRTIEALALAIEAKDHATHDHLGRVQIYSVEIGRELGLKPDELEALRAASLLHDIGKLAVPEHIISKPGRLTPEELEKMKIHPVVGAEILDRVQFPYDVAPIVLSHHEHWDGSGYPHGLAGDAIPIGARILCVVDSLDALASDREFRAALPLDDSVRQIAGQAGTAFDPRVIEILARRYKEFEEKVQNQHAKTPLSKDLKINHGSAPAAGFEQSEPNASPAGSSGFLHLIAAARQEVQSLFELAQDLGNSLRLDETLSVLGSQLRRVLPCDSMTIYIRHENVLTPEYVTGDDFRLFSSLEIPVGEGLSGWVAKNRKPIVNGNPSVEPGYLNDPGKFSKLRSALAVPLEGIGGVLGVLSLYRAERDAFTRDDLRILLAITSKVALSVENALRFRQAEDSATVDYLTGLPNARALFMHLEQELTRAARIEQPVAVLVCDLDGFKQMNDTFGHLEGNRVLRLVAHGLKEACREHDVVARMGGDEFVLILPGMSTEHLDSKRRRFVEIAGEAGREVSPSATLGLSIGQALFPSDGATADELLAEADRRMYRQKHENKMRAAALEPCSAG